MRRLSGSFMLAVLLVLVPVSAYADSVTDLCGSDPNCTVQSGDALDPGSSTGIPSWFAAIAVLVVLAGVAGVVYRISVVRGMARDSGLDQGQATRMALLDDNSVNTAFLAGQLRRDPAPAPAARSTADRLRELDELRTGGLVTEEEYAERRSAILGTL